MAYISAEETRNIKKRLNKAFPEFKFSVRNRHYMSVSVTIVSGPKTFYPLDEWGEEAIPTENHSLNRYRLDDYENSDILKGMYEIINDGNYNNSDPMTDYFDVGFYVNFNVGAWDKPFVLTS